MLFFSSAICSLCMRMTDFKKETSSSSSSTRFFGSQRLEQKLLAFCEAIDLRPDIALENDLENMGDLLIILIFKHNNYLGFIRI